MEEEAKLKAALSLLDAHIKKVCLRARRSK